MQISRVMAGALGSYTLLGMGIGGVIAGWLADRWSRRNMIAIYFFGTGIVHEVDDVRVSNPASNQELLDELGKRFTGYKYDFKKLVKDICTSRHTSVFPDIFLLRRRYFFSLLSSTVAVSPIFRGAKTM